MIFPLVIASISAIIYTVTALYMSLSLQTSLHMALRKESGKISQTIYYLNEVDPVLSETGSFGFRPVVEAETEREYRIDLIYEDRIIRREYGRVYIINEAELIRIGSFLEEEPD